MSYNKTVNEFQFRWIQGFINPWNMISNSDTSVNIILHGLMNPCIHLIESHQLYSVGVSMLSLITNILFNSVTVSKIW